MEAMICYFPLDAHLAGGERNWQAFLLEVAIILVGLNYVYCVINVFFLWYETSLQCVYIALQQPECFKCHSVQFSSRYVCNSITSSFQLFPLGTIAT